MDLVALKSEITRDEGRRNYPYKDTAGIWTGGIGENLVAHGCSQEQIDIWRSTGIPDDTIDYWYDKAVAEAIACCQSVFPSFDTLSDNCQRALTNLAFDLMYELRDWPRLRAAIAAQDWPAAAMSIMDSKFAAQAPNRSKRLADMIDVPASEHS
jgi:GH24 family phage-related lysozyme (muramidase)